MHSGPTSSAHRGLYCTSWAVSLLVTEDEGRPRCARAAPCVYTCMEGSPRNYNRRTYLGSFDRVRPPCVRGEVMCIFPARDVVVPPHRRRCYAYTVHPKPNMLVYKQEISRTRRVNLRLTRERRSTARELFWTCICISRTRAGPPTDVRGVWKTRGPSLPSVVEPIRSTHRKAAKACDTSGAARARRVRCAFLALSRRGVRVHT